MENIKQAQLEMRTNYLNGSTGVLVSGVVWLISGIFAYSISSTKAIWVLLIGGALIYPLTIFLNKLLGFSGAHSKNNPLGKLAMEGTFFMLMCIPLAYGLSLQHTEWFFEGMLLIIGGRYLTFNTIYGKPLFWILGGVLGVAAYLLFTINAKSYVAAFVGAAIEVSFGLFMLINFYSTKKIS